MGFYATKLCANDFFGEQTEIDFVYYTNKPKQ